MVVWCSVWQIGQFIRITASNDDSGTAYFDVGDSRLVVLLSPITGLSENSAPAALVLYVATICTVLSDTCVICNATGNMSYHT